MIFFNIIGAAVSPTETQIVLLSSDYFGANLDDIVLAFSVLHRRTVEPADNGKDEKTLTGRHTGRNESVSRVNAQHVFPSHFYNTPLF